MIVGSGLFGATFAHLATKLGKKCLVIDKRPHLGGNVFCECIEGINVHKYGAHIFHTNNKKVWNYITQFAEFNRFTNSPVANYKGEIYSLPFNMYTFNKMWGVVTPEEAAAKIEEQRKEITGEPKNLEEQAISLVGRDIYEKLIKGYTEKQWGRDCMNLPSFIIKRLPVRLTFDNNYFNALYQGIPVGGYYYTCAVTSRQTEAELNALRAALRGKTFQLPLAIDVEDARLRSLSPAALAQRVAQAAAQLEAWNLYAMVYTYTNFADTALAMDALTAYDLWLADYRGKRPTRPHGMWQYTSTGHVAGIDGPVDLSRAYKDYPALCRRAGLGRFSG